MNVDETLARRSGGKSDSFPHPLYIMTVGLSRFWSTSNQGTLTSSRCALCLNTGFIREQEQTRKLGNSSIELCPYCPARAIFAGRYLVIKQIGIGSFSQVFLVKDVFLGESRVIKILNSGLHELAHSEANWLTRLSYGGERVSVQHFYGLIRHGEHLGLVLEFLQPILVQVSESINKLKRLIVDVALLLHKLHTKPCHAIHADIKLENIMYSERDDRFRLIDFGNCTLFEQISDYFESFEIQSMLYRAPEALIGVEFGPEIDIWSLGVVIAQLLSHGRFPFVGHTRTEVLHQISEIIGPFPITFSEGKFCDSSIPLLTSFNHSDGFWRKWKKSNLARLLGAKDTLLIDLLANILESDPRKRLTANGILRHPFLASFIPFSPPPPPSSSIDDDQEIDKKFKELVNDVWIS